MNNDEDDFRDGQGHWWSQSPTNQVLTPQEPQPPPPPPQEPTEPIISSSSQKTKKKKCRGNRSDQHFRRRLRRQNLDEATQADLIQRRMEEKNKLNHIKENKQSDNDDGTIVIDDNDDEPEIQVYT
jgi:hypothetical protein